MRRWRRSWADVAVSDVKRFESELLDYADSRHSAMLDDLTTRKKGVPDELGDVITAFKAQFVSGAAGGASANPLATDADELGAATSNKTLATE